MLFRSVSQSRYKGVWEAVSTPFMSDESNRLRELYIMGQSLDETGIGLIENSVNKELNFLKTIAKKQEGYVLCSVLVLNGMLCSIVLCILVIYYSCMNS